MSNLLSGIRIIESAQLFNGDSLGMYLGDLDLAQWVKLAAEHDIAMGPAPVTLNEAKEDPHLQTRGIFVEGEHPQAGPFTYLGEAGKVRGQPYEVRYPAPLLGEHTRAILGGELGLGDAELNWLARAKVV